MATFETGLGIIETVTSLPNTLPNVQRRHSFTKQLRGILFGAALPFAMAS
jgi:hypothetical protein